MLRELHISNLAVIEDARIDFTAGLNAFTGQTGAGKSLILGAFEILLGLKSARNIIRPGAKEARISGLFELQNPSTLQRVSELADQSLEPGDQILITRKFLPSGRASVALNGLPITAAMLKNISQHLVDIHGQHDHQFLLKPSNQLHILDNFAGSSNLRLEYTDIYHRLRDLRSQKAELLTSQSLRTQQLDLYEFQADEIDDVDPQIGEFPELQARFKQLANLSKIRDRVQSIQSALYESDAAIVSRLEAMTHVLRDLVELDEGLQPVEEHVRTAALTLQEASFELSRHLSHLDADPQEHAQVEDRLNVLNRLIQKYADPSFTLTEDPTEGVINFRIQIGQQIEELRLQDDDLSQMDDQIASLSNTLLDLGKQLTAKRAAAADELFPLVESQLKDLGMSEAKLRIQIDSADENDLVAFAPIGLDAIEFLVQTNPGQEFRPLRKIASGGELSRIMLAIKSILASADRISVLVFDEIDANIGGRLGSVIGEKLRALAHGITPQSKIKSKAKTSKNIETSEGGSHQVICITHLPQIAAFADQHLHIEKTVTGTGKHKKTATTVATLTGKTRVNELAEMISGKDITPTTRKQARELLASASD
ncbi:DNA repair protein RecN [Poriferisphaera sp. WC338]|uniref:DNA repair protein RecN n=1 Tax=Poriferisphaera sp. WC338 TaxID=3425129 RepID=UPI003D81C30E